MLGQTRLTPIRYVVALLGVLGLAQLVCAGVDDDWDFTDNTSEERLKQQLAEVSANKTLLLVTHRTSMLSLVDRLVIVDRGQIVADGPKPAILEALKKGQIRVS